jgi:anaerobic magnesium-protoporphyrin IX monomethyl ester cyclase
MKIILINPPARTLSHESLVIPPLGLSYLASTLKREGHEVKIIDAFAQGLNWGEFEEVVKKEKTDLIGIGGMTPIIDIISRAITVCRPYTRYLVMGGPHISVYGQDFIKSNPGIDYGIIGEGEYNFIDLISRLEKGRDPWNVSGLIGPDRANPPGNSITDLDQLPFPARNLLPNQSYRYGPWPGEKITTIITSRGCPYHCIFCDKSILGLKWRARSPKNVLDEMEEIVRDLGIRSLIIYDDLFTLDRQRVIDICQGILDRKLRIKWKCEGRVDRVDDEMLRWMSQAGCSMIAYGVESGNQSGLNYLKKGITISQIRRAFSLTHQVKIKPMAYFILGLPMETFDQSMNTIKFAQELNPEYAQFSILSPYKGTKLYEEAKRKGWYQEIKANNPFDKDQKRPVLLSENWTSADLNKILRLAHRKFYLRFSYIINKLRGIKDINQLKSWMRVGMDLLKWYFSRRVNP